MDGRRTAKDVREDVLAQAGVCYDGRPTERLIRLVGRAVRLGDGKLASAELGALKRTFPTSGKGQNHPALSRV